MNLPTERLRYSGVKRIQERSFRDVRHKDRLYLGNPPKAQSEGGRYRGNRDLSYYIANLPTFEELTFFDHARNKTDDSEEVRVLDIGCGEGLALAELKQKLPEVKAFGISATDMRVITPPDDLKPYVDSIDYRIGDAHKLKDIFRGESFDYIISTKTFIHLGDPFRVLKQCYRLLKTGGIAFIEDPGFWLTAREFSKLQQFWESQGVKAELHGLLSMSSEEITQLAAAFPVFNNTRSDFHIAIQRSPEAPRLPMPFKYVKSQFDLSNIGHSKPYVFNLDIGN